MHQKNGVVMANIQLNSHKALPHHGQVWTHELV